MHVGNFYGCSWRPQYDNDTFGKRGVQGYMMTKRRVDRISRNGSKASENKQIIQNFPNFS